MPSRKRAKKIKGCQHPPSRYYGWVAYDGVLCVVCCDCGAVLHGGV